MPDETAAIPPVVPAKRRGRPPRIDQEMANLRALVASMEAKLQEAHRALLSQQDGSTVVLTPEEKRRMEWEDYERRSEAWQAQQPARCPQCGAYAGYNPVTGVQVRQYAGRMRIDGHRDACPVKERDAVKLNR